MKLWLANRANLHTLSRVPAMDNYVKFIGTIDVPVFSLDDFVRYKNIEPKNIDIIRMDMEGHETIALKGMTRTLRETESLLLFIEIHPKLIKQNASSSYESFLRQLKANGFQVLDCSVSLSSRLDERVSIDDIDDLLRFDEAVEVILYKNNSGNTIHN